MAFSYLDWAGRSLQSIGTAAVYGRQTWQTEDDRGKVVPLYAYRPTYLGWRDDTTVIAREDIHWIRRDLRRRGVLGARASNVVIGAIFLVVLWFIAQPLIASGFTSNRFHDWIGPIAGTILIVTLLRGEKTFGSNPFAVRSALLANNRCPCCGYTIAGNKADPDGCTTCPECGSAWRLP